MAKGKNAKLTSPTTRRSTRNKNKIHDQPTKEIKQELIQTATQPTPLDPPNPLLPPELCKPKLQPQLNRTDFSSACQNFNSTDLNSAVTANSEILEPKLPAESNQTRPDHELSTTETSNSKPANSEITTKNNAKLNKPTSTKSKSTNITKTSSKKSKKSLNSKNLPNPKTEIQNLVNLQPQLNGNLLFLIKKSETGQNKKSEKKSSLKNSKSSKATKVASKSSVSPEILEKISKNLPKPTKIASENESEKPVKGQPEIVKNDQKSAKNESENQIHCKTKSHEPPADLQALDNLKPVSQAKNEVTVAKLEPVKQEIILQNRPTNEPKSINSETSKPKKSKKVKKDKKSKRKNSIECELIELPASPLPQELSKPASANSESKKRKIHDSSCLLDEVQVYEKWPKLPKIAKKSKKDTKKDSGWTKLPDPAASKDERTKESKTKPFSKPPTPTLEETNIEKIREISPKPEKLIGPPKIRAKKADKERKQKKLDELKLPVILYDPATIKSRSWHNTAHPDYFEEKMVYVVDKIEHQVSRFHNFYKNISTYNLGARGADYFRRVILNQQKKLDGARLNCQKQKLVLEILELRRNYDLLKKFPDEKQDIVISDYWEAKFKYTPGIHLNPESMFYKRRSVILLTHGFDSSHWVPFFKIKIYQSEIGSLIKEVVAQAAKKSGNWRLKPAVGKEPKNRTPSGDKNRPDPKIQKNLVSHVLESSGPHTPDDSPKRPARTPIQLPPNPKDLPKPQWPTQKENIPPRNPPRPPGPLAPPQPHDPHAALEEELISYGGFGWISVDAPDDGRNQRNQPVAKPHPTPRPSAPPPAKKLNYHSNSSIAFRSDISSSSSNSKLANILNKVTNSKKPENTEQKVIDTVVVLSSKVTPDTPKSAAASPRVISSQPEKMPKKSKADLKKHDDQQKLLYLKNSMDKDVYEYRKLQKKMDKELDQHRLEIPDYQDEYVGSPEHDIHSPDDENEVKSPKSSENLRSTSQNQLPVSKNALHMIQNQIPVIKSRSKNPKLKQRQSRIRSIEASPIHVPSSVVSPHTLTNSKNADINKKIAVINASIDTPASAENLNAYDRYNQKENFSTDGFQISNNLVYPIQSLENLEPGITTTSSCSFIETATDTGDDNASQETVLPMTKEKYEEKMRQKNADQSITCLKQEVQDLLISTGSTENLDDMVDQMIRALEWD